MENYKPLILIVDQDSKIQRLLQGNYDIRAVEDGMKALTQYRFNRANESRELDLFITYLKAPASDGF